MKPSLPYEGEAWGPAFPLKVLTEKWEKRSAKMRKLADKCSTTTGSIYFGVSSNWARQYAKELRKCIKEFFR